MSRCWQLPLCVRHRGFVSNLVRRPSEAVDNEAVAIIASDGLGRPSYSNIRSATGILVLTSCLIALLLLCGSRLYAQTVVTPTPMTAADAKRHAEAVKAQEAQKAGEPKDAKKDQAKEQEKGSSEEKEKEESSGPKPIMRSDDPPSTEAAHLPDPPDKDTMIQLNFRGEKWPAVLQWLADWSQMSLDWQQLPGDYLQLTTNRRFSAREARDLLNRLLLSRGYTMLIKEDVLSVFEVKKLDAGMVPRVTPEQLAERDPHEFVKVSFTLDWLLAETAVKELEPMKSPNGKLSPLSKTNRIEAMDAVINLREIYALLIEEQSDVGQEQLVRKFSLHHTRAEEVRSQLLALFGVEAKSSRRPKTPQEIQHEMQLAQMKVQQAKKGKAKPQAKVEIHLVAIPRENTILANAPPDKMAAIEQAIRAIDVPLESTGHGRSRQNVLIYRLSTIDPQELVTTLQEIGNLEFNTRLQVDKKNNAIIAYASIGDHFTIHELVKKLDGSTRQFSVIQLRRLEADYVAGTIQFMMGGKEEKKPQRRRSRWNRYDTQDENKKEDEFSVDADVVHNRLLLRANADEKRQVEDLLVKLGEIPSQDGDPSTLRVIDAADDEATRAWLERIRRAWNGPNELEFELPDDEPEATPRRTRARPEQSRPRATPTEDATTLLLRSPELARRLRATPPEGTPSAAPREGLEQMSACPSIRLPMRLPARLVQFRQDNLDPVPQGDADEAATQGSAAAESSPPDNVQESPFATDRQRSRSRENAPPIKINRGLDGKLVITCEDPRALDELENLMLDFPPPRREYAIFPLKHAKAQWTVIDLRDFFKEKEEESRRGYSWWDYAYGSSNETTTPSRLSKRRPLKFIAHWETNSILVQGATPSQLRTIEDLIKNVFDRRDPEDKDSDRKWRRFELRYSKAKVVAEMVKEVFRDLLSTNDKALQQNQKPKGGPERVYNFNYSDSKDPQKKFQYKGALSIGVDELSNALVVSCEPFLFDKVSEMIVASDLAAKPTTTVQTVHVGYGVNASELQRTLSLMLGQPTAGQPAQRRKEKPMDKKPGKKQQAKQQQANRSASGGSTE